MKEFPREYFINGLWIEDRGANNSVTQDIGVERFTAEGEGGKGVSVMRSKNPLPHRNAKITIYGSGNTITIGRKTRLLSSNINISGSGNSVSIGEKSRLNGTTFNVKGEETRLYIGDHCKTRHFKIVSTGDRNSIELGRSVGISGFLEMSDSNNTLSIGNNVSVVSAKFFLAEGRTISIGDDCMVSWEVIFRTSDMHGILDAKTRRRVNKPGDITLERHVWVAAQAMLLKGTYVSKNSIVGTRATTTKKFTKPGVILGGTPAQVIKEGITWSKKLTPCEEELTPAVIDNQGRKWVPNTIKKLFRL